MNGTRPVVFLFQASDLEANMNGALDKIIIIIKPPSHVFQSFIIKNMLCSFFRVYVCVCVYVPMCILNSGLAMCSSMLSIFYYIHSYSLTDKLRFYFLGQAAGKAGRTNGTCSGKNPLHKVYIYIYIYMYDKCCYS